MKSEQIKEITDRAAEQLVAALQAGHSEALTVYLKAIGRFHRYSLQNVLLIASQKPNASYVAGFRTWNALGRFVRKGEKGIMILAPIVRRKTQNDDEQRDEISRPIAGFRAAFVFDISQTDGKELPQIGAVQAIRASTVTSCVSLRRRRIFWSNFPPTSHRHGAYPSVDVLPCCPASHQPRNFQLLRTKSLTSFCIAVTAGPAPLSEFERPKLKPPRLLSVRQLASKPVRLRLTISSCGMATRNS
jgi:N-terminal domain of anti-restriction factor ArdC